MDFPAMFDETSGYLQWFSSTPVKMLGSHAGGVAPSRAPAASGTGSIAGDAAAAESHAITGPGPCYALLCRGMQGLDGLVNVKKSERQPTLGDVHRM